MGLNDQPTTNHQQPPSNTQQTTTLKMKSLATVVFFNIALARPDHGVVHHGAHHTVHHQPATVHHAVHSVHQPVLHHAVHHNAVHHNAFHHQPVHQPVVPEDALAGLLANKEELKKVLLRHVVPSTIQGKNIPPGTTTLTAASGDKIDVTRDQNNLIQIKSTAGSAYVVLFDVIASNGVVHAVDSVF